MRSFSLGDSIRQRLLVVLHVALSLLLPFRIVIRIAVIAVAALARRDALWRPVLCFVVCGNAARACVMRGVNLGR